MAIYQTLIAPFADFGFMRRALVACLALSTGAGGLGVFLLLRRMSLVGDTLGHAILPGAAAGFLLAGLSLPAMGLGGLVAGLIVVALSSAVSHLTRLNEDASLAAFYLTSLALGVLMISAGGTNADLLHVLFGSVLAVDATSLYLIGTIASGTIIGMAFLYRPLVVECFDPLFLRVSGKMGTATHLTFMALVVINLVAAFQVLGTLMAVGLLMLPAAAARLWAHTLPAMIVTASAIGFASAYVGLLASFHFGVASGPAIILCASLFYVASLLLGKDGLFSQSSRPLVSGADAKRGR